MLTLVKRTKRYVDSCKTCVVATMRIGNTRDISIKQKRAVTTSLAIEDSLRRGCVLNGREQGEMKRARVRNEIKLTLLLQLTALTRGLKSAFESGWLLRDLNDSCRGYFGFVKYYRGDATQNTTDTRCIAKINCSKLNSLAVSISTTRKGGDDSVLK